MTGYVTVLAIVAAACCIGLVLCAVYDWRRL